MVFDIFSKNKFILYEIKCNCKNEIWKGGGIDRYKGGRGWCCFVWVLRIVNVFMYFRVMERFIYFKLG